MKPIIRGNRQLVDEALLRSTRKAASITSQFEIPLVTTLATTSDNSFTRIGGKFIDFTQFALVDNLGRPLKVVFSAEVDQTGGATSVEIQLFDLTDNILITGTDLVAPGATLPTLVASPQLVLGNAAGDLRLDGTKYYEVLLRMNGGVPINDQVACSNASLILSY
jgi:hypothetical protein